LGVECASNCRACCLFSVNLILSVPNPLLSEFPCSPARPPHLFDCFVLPQKDKVSLYPRRPHVKLVILRQLIMLFPHRMTFPFPQSACD